MRCEVMERSGGQEDEEEEIWGTWEELLLACGVHRHGTRSWDSVAVEVQARSLSGRHLFPEGCKQRYHQLQRRFASSGDEIDERGGQLASEIPWLEELRNLRVAELRRDVQRYDVSIVSLQFKVKKLNEERERSLREAVAGDGGSDLKAAEDREDGESPEYTPGDVHAGSGGADPIAGGDEKSVGEVGESGDSVAESKGGEAEGAKDSSEVKSSGDLSRRLRGRRRTVVSGLTGGSGVGDELVADAISPVCNPIAAGSQPLLAFLDIIRAHRCGSVFERRFESQESSLYGSLIRRHVDLEMVQSRIVGVPYTTSEFFRDLLLLCNNALVYYPKNSPEYISAVHLRRLISKEMAATLRNPGPPPAPAKESTPSPPPPPNVMSMPASVAPLIACRKRSSISGKAAETIRAAVLAAKKEERQLNPDLLQKERGMDEDSRALSGARGPRSNKSRRNSGNIGGVGALNPIPNSKIEKKRSATNFLSRINRGSLSPNCSVLETMKSSSASGSGSRGAKQAPRKNAPVQRSVGRPPKRPALSILRPTAKRLRGEVGAELRRTPQSGKGGRR